MKRTLDFVLALAGVVLLIPLFVIVALLVKWDSPGPAFFRQVRVGRKFKPFRIYKFRTMADRPEAAAGRITVGADPRVTRVGIFLRRFKIDELPQLFNVLKGEMSLVGPRPELEHYVRLFRDDYAQVLKVRPGITDLASLKYSDESAVLARSPDPEREYVERILPEKIRLAKEYAAKATLAADASVVARTILKLVRGGSS